MRIGEPRLRTEGETLVYSAPLRIPADAEPQPLEFRVPVEHADLVSERADAALVAALIPAMRTGGELVIEGPVTDELVFSVQHDYQELLRRQMPRLRPVSIRAVSALPADPAGEGVATGFSGGVDSWQVLSEYHAAADVPQGMKITHLLYNDVGSHGAGGEELFERRFNRLRPVAAEVGLPLISVSSTMGWLYPKSAFSRTHTPRNAAVPHLLQNGLRHFYYASAYDYASVRAQRTKAIAMADPIALPLMSTTALSLRSVGSALSRVQKTLAIIDMPATYTSLDVCLKPGDSDLNCTRCWKCRRTALTLEIAGALESYSKVFDLEAWEGIRAPAWEYAVKKTDSPLEQEVVAFGREQGYAPG